MLDAFYTVIITVIRVHDDSVVRLLCRRNDSAVKGVACLVNMLKVGPFLSSCSESSSPASNRLNFAISSTISY